jgi:hypothetical protein
VVPVVRGVITLVGGEIPPPTVPVALVADFVSPLPVEVALVGRLVTLDAGVVPLDAGLVPLIAGPVPLLHTEPLSSSRFEWSKASR